MRYRILLVLLLSSFCIGSVEIKDVGIIKVNKNEVYLLSDFKKMSRTLRIFNCMGERSIIHKLLEIHDSDFKQAVFMGSQRRGPGKITPLMRKYISLFKIGYFARERTKTALFDSLWNQWMVANKDSFNRCLKIISLKNEYLNSRHSVIEGLKSLFVIDYYLKNRFQEYLNFLDSKKGNAFLSGEEGSSFLIKARAHIRMVEAQLVHEEL